MNAKQIQNYIPNSEDQDFPDHQNNKWLATGDAGPIMMAKFSAELHAWIKNFQDNITVLNLKALEELSIPAPDSAPIVVSLQDNSGRYPALYRVYTNMRHDTWYSTRCCFSHSDLVCLGVQFSLKKNFLCKWWHNCLHTHSPRLSYTPDSVSDMLPTNV